MNEIPQLCFNPEVCSELWIGTQPGLLEKSVDYIRYTLVFIYGLMNIRVQNQKRFLFIRKRQYCLFRAQSKDPCWKLFILNVKRGFFGNLIFYFLCTLFCRPQIPLCRRMLGSNPGLLRIFFGIDSQTLDFIHNRLDLIHIRLDIIHTRLDLIENRLDLIHTRLDLIHTRLDPF